MVYALFIAGFFLLIQWADFLVDGASALAKKFSISDIVIWLTIVGFGTSAPELVINVISSISWNSWLVFGNILGSNITNLLLILWICAIIYPLKITKRTVFFEIPFSILAVVLLIIMINDRFIYGHPWLFVSRIDGIILLCFFALFLRYTFYITRKKQDLPVDVPIIKMSLTKMIIYIIWWLAGLTIWGKWVVDGALSIAIFFGVSQSIVGLTVVALWTSLPELATSVIAVMKKNPDIAIGNIVGSNIFNILWILWISVIISPIYGDIHLNRDVWILLASSGILFAFILLGKKFVLQRYQWRILVFLYIVYISVVISNTFY